MELDEATNQRTVHGKEIGAPAETVYELLADVRQWPVMFPPTIHAEVLEQGREERIQLWATANETAKTWTSRRWLDRQNLCIDFEQEVPQDPVAAMSGRWVIRPGVDGTCSVDLHHEFSAVADDREALSWIERAVENNSAKELDALEVAAKRVSADPRLVFEFSDSIEVAGTVCEAYEFIDRADAWRERLPHVADVDLTIVAPNIQLLEMDTTARDGSTHRTSSYRVCLPHRAIAYKQTVFPPFLTGHLGLWSFDEADGTSRVTSSHTVVLDPAELGRLPESARSVRGARDFVTQALSENSKTTLRALKEFVEGGK